MWCLRLESVHNLNHAVDFFLRHAVEHGQAQHLMGGLLGNGEIALVIPEVLIRLAQVRRDGMGVSKERARQIERQAMDKLQQLGAGMGLEDFLE